MKRRAGDSGGTEPKRARANARDAGQSATDDNARAAPKDTPDGVLTPTPEGDRTDASSTATTTTSVGDKAPVQDDREPAKEQRVAGSSTSVPRPRSADWVVSPSGQHFKQSFVSRLDTFFTYTDEETKRFYIDKAPTNIAWGAGQWSRFLCVSGEPVLFWMVCELTSDYFLCAPGCNAAKSISASVGFLREADLACARRLLRVNQRYTPAEAPKQGEKDKGRPSTDTAEASKQVEKDTVRLSTKTSSFNCTKQLVTWLFEDIYDGRHADDFGPKETMARMRPDEIGTGDVLLAECYLTRYHCDAEGKVVYERAGEKLRWNRWRTGFDIRYLTLLRSGEDVEDTTMPKFDDSKTTRM